MAIGIVIQVRDHNGRDSDPSVTYELSDFAGVVPTIGDTILNPIVNMGLDRNVPEARIVWKVVDRVFNFRDSKDRISLIVEARPGNEDDNFL